MWPPETTSASGRGRRLVRGLLLRQQNRVDVALQVVDRDQRLAQSESQRLGVRDAHQQRARQSGPSVTAMASRSAKADARLGHRRPHHRNDVAQMFARRQFRNHPAVRRVDGDLRRDDARKHPARPRSTTAAAVSSQELSIARIRPLPAMCSWPSCRTFL